MTDHLPELWRNWWDGDIWIPPWTKALDGLTPEQAAWSPSPGRHSIWQHVNHIVYWRDISLRRITGEPSSGREPTHDEQFAAPTLADADSWTLAREQLRVSHESSLTALEGGGSALNRLRYHLAHDSYHLGQIMLLRALQGLPPVL